MVADEKAARSEWLAFASRLILPPRCVVNLEVAGVKHM